MEDNTKNYPKTGFETSTSTGLNETHPDQWAVNKKAKDDQQKAASTPKEQTSTPPPQAKEK